MTLLEARERLPMVALVGRPNVGKSTLFNRYAGHRRALVADQPGLTRDRIAERVELAGRRFWLVDTAGLDPVKEEGLAANVQAQARAAVEAADAILFVVDGKQGLLPEDEVIAAMLRRSGKPLALLVNKVDQPSHHADRIHDFHRLGIERTFPVSAEHGGGVFDALETFLEDVPEATAEYEEIDPETRPVRIAIVGRPNVGKSSTANRLAGQERVVVSETPGTTRDAIDIAIEHEGRPYVLVDTAGLRRAIRRSGPGERGGALMTLRAIERADVALLVLDASEGITDQDARVASLIRENGCAAVVLANKWDRVPSERRAEITRGIEHGLRFMSDVPIVPVSALTGRGYGPLFRRIRAVARAATDRVPTADLNRWLQDVSEKHPPSMAAKGALGRRPNKLFYASQVAVRPPTFVVMCTDPKAVQTSYVRFLENQLRESFGFEGTPVRVKLRARRAGGRSRPSKS